MLITTVHFSCLSGYINKAMHTSTLNKDNIISRGLQKHPVDQSRKNVVMNQDESIKQES